MPPPWCACFWWTCIISRSKTLTCSKNPPTSDWSCHNAGGTGNYWHNSHWGVGVYTTEYEVLYRENRNNALYPRTKSVLISIANILWKMLSVSGRATWWRASIKQEVRLRTKTTRRMRMMLIIAILLIIIACQLINVISWARQCFKNV